MDKEEEKKMMRKIKDAFCLSNCDAVLCDTCHSLGTCNEYDNFCKRINKLFENVKD